MADIECLLSFPFLQITGDLVFIQGQSTVGSVPDPSYCIFVPISIQLACQGYA